jgi:hypothetical protein
MVAESLNHPDGPTPLCLQRANVRVLTPSLLAASDDLTKFVSSASFIPFLRGRAGRLKRAEPWSKGIVSSRQVSRALRRLPALYERFSGTG